MVDKYKVTITFYTSSPEIYRNQTDAQVKQHTQRHLHSTDTIKNVRVEREPRIKIVKDNR